MAAAVDIYNQALMRIGIYDGLISDPAEKTKPATVCTAFFDSCLERVLREIPWNFAERRVTLAQLGDGPTNWGYRYSYPSDCLMIRRIETPGIRNTRADQRIPFQVGSTATGREIYCDLSEAEAVYTTKVDDLNQWDSIARSALAYLLAAEIAMPLAVKPDIAQAAMQGYWREVNTAAAMTLNERQHDPEPDPESLAVRGATSSPNWLAQRI